MESASPQAPLFLAVSQRPLRLLCVAAREPRWTPLTVQMSLACAVDVRVVWVSYAKAAIAELRAASFDAVLWGETAGSWTDSTTVLVDFVTAVETLETAVALVVLLALPDDQFLAELYSRNCDVCVSPRMWDSPALPAVVVTAIERRQHAHYRQRCVAITK